MVITDKIGGKMPDKRKGRKSLRVGLTFPSENDCAECGHNFEMRESLEKCPICGSEVLACNGCVSGTGEGNGCKTCEWGTNFQELL